MKTFFENVPGSVKKFPKVYGKVYNICCTCIMLPMDVSIHDYFFKNSKRILTWWFFQMEKCVISEIVEKIT